MIDLYQVSLKVFLKNSEGEILILRSRPNSSWGRSGFFDLPGGRIDEEEFTMDFEDIIKREVCEELGDVDIQVALKPMGFARRIAQSGEHAGRHVLYIFFEAAFIGGEIQISHEHAGYEWVRLGEISIEHYFAPEFAPAVKAYVAA